MKKYAFWIGGTVFMVVVGLFFASRIPMVAEFVGLNPKRPTDLNPFSGGMRRVR